MKPTHPLIKIIVSVILWAMLVFGVAIAARLMFCDAPLSHTNQSGAGMFEGQKALVTCLVRWDAIHYIQIVMIGYPSTYNLEGIRAFFPLYPLLLRWLLPLASLITKEGLSALLIVSLVINVVSLIAGMHFLRKLFETDFGREGALLSALLVFLSPWAFFYLSIYTEAFFLFLSTAAFWAVIKKKWWLGAGLAALASATRLQGLFLLPCFLIEYLHDKKWQLSKIKADVLWLALCPVGFFAYIRYLGGFQNYMEAYKKWPKRIFNPNILTPVINYFRRLWTGEIRPSEQTRCTLEETLCIMSVFIAFGLLVYAWKKLRPSYRFYTVVSLVVPLLTTIERGVGRYYTLIFPLYFAAAIFLSKRRVVLYGSILACAMFGALLIAGFTTGHFVG